jgi:hypothetical protein
MAGEHRLLVIFIVVVLVIGFYYGITRYICTEC